MLKNISYLLMGSFLSFSMHFCAHASDSESEVENECFELFNCDDIQNSCCDNGAAEPDADGLGLRICNIVYGLAQIPCAFLNCFTNSARRSFLDLMIEPGQRGPNLSFIFDPRKCCGDRCEIYPAGIDAVADWEPTSSSDNPLEPASFDRIDGSTSNPWLGYPLMKGKKNPR